MLPRTNVHGLTDGSPQPPIACSRGTSRVYGFHFAETNLGPEASLLLDPCRRLVSLSGYDCFYNRELLFVGVHIARAPEFWKPGFKVQGALPEIYLQLPRNRLEGVRKKGHPCLSLWTCSETAPVRGALNQADLKGQGSEKVVDNPGVKSSKLGHN